MILVPYEFQGDGRKREAKRHKSRTAIPQEEIDLDQLIRDFQNSNRKIQELEHQLEDLKNQRISKRELQSQRNRLTAQLSRDRQKLELSFLKAQCVNYQRLLKRLERKITDADSACSDSLCLNCTNVLRSALKSHKCSLTAKSTSDDENVQKPLFDEPVKKRLKTDSGSLKPYKSAKLTTVTSHIQERKNVLVKGATAIIASLGFLAAANHGQSSLGDSQALVEVRNDYLSMN